MVARSTHNVPYSYQPPYGAALVADTVAPPHSTVALSPPRPLVVCASPTTVPMPMAYGQVRAGPFAGAVVPSPRHYAGAPATYTARGAPRVGAPAGPWSGVCPLGSATEGPAPISSPFFGASAGAGAAADTATAKETMAPMPSVGATITMTSPSTNLPLDLMRTLAKVDPSEQKQLLGEAIYPQIAETQPDLAGKLTGMLLEMSVSDLVVLAQNRDSLDAKVEEGLYVLREHAQLDDD